MKRPGSPSCPVVAEHGLSTAVNDLTEIQQAFLRELVGPVVPRPQSPHIRVLREMFQIPHVSESVQIQATVLVEIPPARITKANTSVITRRIEIDSVGVMFTQFTHYLAHRFAKIGRASCRERV